MMMLLLIALHPLLLRIWPQLRLRRRLLRRRRLLLGTCRLHVLKLRRLSLLLKADLLVMLLLLWCWLLLRIASGMVRLLLLLLVHYRRLLHELRLLRLRRPILDMGLEMLLLLLLLRLLVLHVDDFVQGHNIRKTETRSIT